MSEPRYAWPSDFGGGPAPAGQVNPNLGFAQVLDLTSMLDRAESETKLLGQYAAARTRRNEENQKALTAQKAALEGKAFGVRDQKMRQYLLEQRDKLEERLSPLMDQGIDITDERYDSDPVATRKLKEARELTAETEMVARNESIPIENYKTAQEIVDSDDKLKINTPALKVLQNGMSPEESSAFYQKQFGPDLGLALARLEIDGVDASGPLGTLNPGEWTPNLFITAEGLTSPEVAKKVGFNKLMQDEGFEQRANGTWIISNEARVTSWPKIRNLAANAAASEMVYKDYLTELGRASIAKAAAADEQTEQAFQQFQQVLQDNGKVGGVTAQAFNKRMEEYREMGYDDMQAINAVMYEMGTGRDASSPEAIENGRVVKADWVGDNPLGMFRDPTTGQPRQIYGALEAYESGNMQKIANVAAARWADENFARLGEEKRTTANRDSDAMNRAQSTANKQKGAFMSVWPEGSLGDINIWDWKSPVQIGESGEGLYVDERFLQLSTSSKTPLPANAVVVDPATGNLQVGLDRSSIQNVNMQGLTMIPVNAKTGRIATRPGPNTLWQAAAVGVGEKPVAPKEAKSQAMLEIIATMQPEEITEMIGDFGQGDVTANVNGLEYTMKELALGVFRNDVEIMEAAKAADEGLYKALKNAADFMQASSKVEKDDAGDMYVIIEDSRILKHLGAGTKQALIDLGPYVTAAQVEGAVADPNKASGQDEENYEPLGIRVQPSQQQVFVPINDDLSASSLAGVFGGQTIEYRDVSNKATRELLKGYSQVPGQPGIYKPTSGRNQDVFQ